MPRAGNFRRQVRCVFLLLMLMTGCSWHRGYYDASEAPGWHRKYWSLVERHPFVFHPNSKVMRTLVSFSTIRKGELSCGFSNGGGFRQPDLSAERNSMNFPTNNIRIIYEDLGREDLVPRKKRGQTLYVGDSESFTVILPPFTVNGKPVPELSVHFKWSKRRYLVLEDIGL
jgi:hypothetical protein